MAAPQETPKSDEIVSEIRIAAPPQRVFQALVDPLLVVQWWGQTSIYRCTKFENDLRVGGMWRSTGVDGNGRQFEIKGEYLELDPPGFYCQPGWRLGLAMQRPKCDGNLNHLRTEPLCEFVTVALRHIRNLLKRIAAGQEC